MKPSSRSLPRLIALAAACSLASGMAQEPAPDAKDLAARLSSAVQDGSSKVLLRMEIKPAAGGAATKLQIRIAARRTQAASDIVYQVLFPKERKGEAFLLSKKAGQAPSGSAFTPPDSLKQLAASQMQESVFGSDLTYQDVIENFFSWQNQAVTGSETIDRAPCHILESKPGSGERSSYGRVRSWIDAKKLVPLRIEKYLPSGQLACRIDTTRVAKDDLDRNVAASLMIRRPGRDTVTELEGSNSRHDVTYQDADFTTEALKSLVK